LACSQTSAQRRGRRRRHPPAAGPAVVHHARQNWQAARSVTATAGPCRPTTRPT